MKEIVNANSSVLHDLRAEGFRLKNWERAWGLHDASSQPHQHLNPNDEQYRFAVASLARIVAVFARIAESQARCQSEPEKSNKSGKRHSLGALLSRIRSKPPSLGTSSTSRPMSPSPQFISGLNLGDLNILENPKILANPQLLPGPEEEISSLYKVAQSMQQSVPTFRKLRWASMDKAKIENLLKKLKQKIEEGAATMDIIQVVLHGMGGIGKTQLVLAYVYRHCREYSSVFWVNAATEETTKISFTHIMQRLIKYHAKFSDKPDYTHIGQLLGIAGKLDLTGMFTIQQPSEEQHVVNAVHEWLSIKNNTKWLLIFDNVDNVESFNINDYLPPSAHGTVIITSRRKETIQRRRFLMVKQMDNSEVEELIFKIAKLDLEKLTPDERTREKEAAAAIVQKLEHLPLAIDQAGAYIHNREYSFSRYLREYEAKVTYLLSKDWKAGKADRSVFAAWDLSFQAIQNQNPKAAEFLLLCGLLDINDICEELLQRGMKLPVNDTSLGDLIQMLFSYSMAKRKDRDDSFSIHPLIHIWAQMKLESDPERHSRIAIEAFLMVASATAIPSTRGRKADDWVFERRILPHVIAIEKQMKYLLAIESEEAEEVYNVLLVRSEQLLGIDHLDTLNAVNNMGNVFLQQGQHNKALEWYERALAGREKALGTDHPDTLAVVYNMACVFYGQGQYGKALEWHKRALAGEEKTLGADHPDTLTVVYNMACLFHQQGQYNKALEWYERALAGEEKALGADHPNTLMTVNEIATVFYQQGQYNKALEWYERALAGRKKVLGEDYLDTLTTVNYMAHLSKAMGKSEDVDMV
ncbi:P-loop containing nucleoside triphosphate hydrolase protein [Kalaharituber pfeilii]|nr:P-loop containing nucleoside triphosphate hydrolase protein [Kalaharituber pfeilii]